MRTEQCKYKSQSAPLRQPNDAHVMLCYCSGFNAFIPIETIWSHSQLGRRTQGSYIILCILWTKKGPSTRRRSLVCDNFGSWGAKRFVQRAGVCCGGLWKQSRMWRNWIFKYPRNVPIYYIYNPPIAGAVDDCEKDIILCVINIIPRSNYTTALLRHLWS